ncbi:hypothetical protein LTR39_006185, partial [Cryomyces antarcticus]
ARPSLAASPRVPPLNQQLRRLLPRRVPSRLQGSPPKPPRRRQPPPRRQPLRLPRRP